MCSARHAVQSTGPKGLSRRPHESPGCSGMSGRSSASGDWLCAFWMLYWGVRRRACTQCLMLQAGRACKHEQRQQSCDMSMRVGCGDMHLLLSAVLSCLLSSMAIFQRACMVCIPSSAHAYPPALLRRRHCQRQHRYAVQLRRWALQGFSV